MKAVRGVEHNGALKSRFSTSASKGRPKEKPAAPFSIRLSEEERAHLRREAGSLSLAAHIRRRLFGDTASPRRSRKPSRRPQRPALDQEALGRVLGELGKSRLSSNLNQIAKAANIGTLPVTPDLADELQQACADIRAMRAALVAALGIKPEDGP